MNEQQRQRAESMRNMSGEQMAERQLRQALGATNAANDLTPWHLAQASQNWWGECAGSIPVEPMAIQTKPTKWARFKRWFLG